MTRVGNAGNAIVVGTGVAGATAALTLRSTGYEGRIVLIGEEPDEPYRKPPLSKDVLRGTMPFERTRLRAPQTWEQQDVELRTGERVVDVDVLARKLELDGGERLDYELLLFATGGSPRPLPVADGMAGVHMLRSASDVPALRDRLAEGSRVLVIGAGLIGAEVAATARSRGCAVTMLEAEPTPLSRLLPPRVAGVYADLHRSHGVELHTGVDVTGVERTESGLVTTDADGRGWTADTVVVAIGMVPNTELAERAGIAVDNGILVDEYFETSVPGVFAAGDVANQPNLMLGGRQRIEHWQSAQEQGAAAARNMLGDRTPFSQVPWCWSDQYGVNLQVAGWPMATDDLSIRGEVDSLNFTAVFHRDGRLVGAVGVNRAKEIRALRKLIATAPGAGPELLADDATDLGTLASSTVSTALT
ncbi:NAD(P)/FAD-dependent oxidoreductase [Haloechinothrix halophila]|uniref:NAD(P)/FAD-dependent oxidoreductase n=1 Tax=Haloechinothrix halophila TaxID=1069073 RepID=UPI000421754B|nr:FAD-dependent oxidoreductase [Haloechinothrix halophila]